MNFQGRIQSELVVEFRQEIRQHGRTQLMEDYAIQPCTKMSDDELVNQCVGIELTNMFS